MQSHPPGPFDLPPRPISERIALTAGNARAEIAARGAEPVSWSIGGVELLWDADPSWWPKSSPVLFPVCCQTKDGTVRVDGKAYPMSTHGFAPTKTYSIERQSERHVRMILASDDETMASYPFAFRFQVDYELSDASLCATFTISNLGDRDMPYAVGFHPGFNWPFTGGQKHLHRLVFEEPESPFVPKFRHDGLIESGVRALPLSGRMLPLGPGLIDEEPHCFLNAASNRITFENDLGDAIDITTTNFAHFAVWSKADAPFLSIESWTGHSDPVDFEGDLFEKPSMRRLKPSDEARLSVKLTFSRGG